VCDGEAGHARILTLVQPRAQDDEWDSEVTLAVVNHFLRGRPTWNNRRMDDPLLPPLGTDFRHDLVRGARSGLETFWMLARTMVPAYGAALVLEKIGVIGVLAHVAQPVMSLIGLPGSAAVPLVIGYVLNVYAAVGAIQALHLTSQQITVLALAILIGHNLLVEGAVLRRAGMNGTAFGLLRVVAGLAAAGVVNLLMKAV